MLRKKKFTYTCAEVISWDRMKKKIHTKYRFGDRSRIIHPVKTAFFGLMVLNIPFQWKSGKSKKIMKNQQNPGFQRRYPSPKLQFWFLHEEKYFSMRFFKNLIYASSAFQRARLKLQRTKTTTLARDNVSETPNFADFSCFSWIFQIFNSNPVHIIYGFE